MAIRGWPGPGFMKIILCAFTVVLGLSSCAIMPTKIRRPLISETAETYTKLKRFWTGNSRKWMDWQLGDLERLKIDDGYLTIQREIPGTSNLRHWKANVWAPPEDQWNGRILWYFYGAFDDHGDFTRGFARETYYQIWQKLGPQKPILASLALGGFWMIDDELQPKIERLMLEVERQISEQRPYVPENPARWLFGVSMGGFNVLQLHLFSERLRFEKVMAASSLIPPCDLFADDKAAKRACLDRIKDDYPEVVKFHLNSAMQAACLFFSEDEWRRRNPLEVARRGEFSAPDKVLLIAGAADEFGFDLTTRQLGELIGRPACIHPQNHVLPRQIPQDLARCGEFAQELIAQHFLKALP